MIAVFLVCLLSWTRWSAVEAQLTPPQKLTVLAINTNYTLRWDYKQSATAPNRVVFTTEFISKYNLTNKKKKLNWTTACKESPELSCDLTNSGLFYLTIYHLRVRASANGNHSAWALKEFCPDKDASIGPPNVSLHSNGTNLEVSIKDPVFVKSTLRTIFHSPSYITTYWKKDQKKELKHINSLQQNRVVLHSLDPWTEYCVQVQIIASTAQKPSMPSRVGCASTTGEKEPLWVGAVVTFFIMAGVMSLVVLVVHYWRSFSHFLCPKYAIPEHFKESLLAPPKSSLHLVMQTYQPMEEFSDQISVVMCNRTEEDGGCSK